MANTHPTPASKPFYKKWWFITAAIVIIIVAISQGTKGDKKDAPAVETAAQAPVSPEATEEAQPAESEAPKPEEKAEAPAPAAPEVTTDVQTLVTAYTENELGADKEYKGKTAQISGTMSKVSDVLDHKVLWVGTGAEFEIHEVACQLTDEALDRAASLKKGDALTIIGKIEGFNQISVDLADCTIQ